MAAYSDPVLDKLIEKLNAAGPVKLRKQFYQGDPVIIPTSMQLPVCFITRANTAVSQWTNQEDLHAMPIVLNVVYNGAKELNQKAFAQAGALALYELCEGRNSTYDIRDDSILGVLRDNQVLDSANNLFIDYDTDTTIEYALSPPERRSIWSVEAVIRTTIKHITVR